MDVERVEKEGKAGPVEWRVVMTRNSPIAKRALWGLSLMAVGTLLLLGQMGVVSMPALWKFWPVVLFVMGVGSLLEGKPGGAAMFTGIGVAFFAAIFNWWGLTYRTFWPLLVVAVGVGMVIGALSGEDACDDEAEADHGAH